jgi:hypothetical protein
MAGIAPLRSAASAISLAAAASFLFFLATPISFAVALRRACACSTLPMTARRRSSSASTRFDSGVRPRRAKPASNASGLSRIHLMSCMAAA